MSSGMNVYAPNIGTVGFAEQSTSGFNSIGEMKTYDVEINFNHLNNIIERASDSPETKSISVISYYPISYRISIVLTALSVLYLLTFLIGIQADLFTPILALIGSGGMYLTIQKAAKERRESDDEKRD